MKIGVLCNPHNDYEVMQKAMIRYIQNMEKKLNLEGLSKLEYKRCANSINIEELKKLQKQ